ncbi:Origin of replication complex subunit 6 [Coemansia guatemalensis]|uniref:Origin of replication complex subunit 6 n=1 Tax=Coemansia guatemalensis TaxID=2761395 RepID=A0A9W8HUD4_9FUNG|nr:Origin of replication complex subunit 6 [Coemansia guatemalensis]
MSAILAEFIAKLQLEDVPNLAPKAAQFFSQLGQKLAGSKNNSLALCRQTVAIQLACECLSVEFNEAAACSISSISPQIYQTCLKEARALLGLTKHVTLDELNVQFGPPEGVIECSRMLLDEFRRTLGASMPASVSRSMDWNSSVYVVGAFFLACKHLKRRVVAKPKLITMAAVKPVVFNNAVLKLEQFGKSALANIDSRGAGAIQTPSQKRPRESVQDIDSEDASRSSVRTMSTRTPKAATPVPVDEIGGTVRKRARRTTSIQQPATEPIRRTRSIREQLGTPPVLGTAPKNAPEESETPVKRKRGRPPMTPAQKIAKHAAAATAAVSAAAAARKKKKAAVRLRIGTISMVRDQDYRSTPLYESYQQWRATMLQTK